MTKTKNLCQRMIAAQGDVGGLEKDREASYQKTRYNYVSHDDVTAAAKKALISHGVLFVTSVQSYKQDGNRTEVLVTGTFINIDDPTQEISVQGVGYGCDYSDKGAGKAVSYAVKYILAKALLIGTGSNDDVEGDDIPHKQGDDAPQQDEKPPASPKLTKAQSREVYTKMQTKLRNATDVASLEDIWKANAEQIGTMDSSFFYNLIKEAGRLRVELSKKVEAA